MKKLLLSIGAVLATQTMHAKDYTLVVKGSFGTAKGKTEVKSEPGETSDTITVMPGKDATTIVALVRDVEGNVLGVHTLSAMWDDHVYIICPHLPDGVFLEVKDDRGVLYKF